MSMREEFEKYCREDMGWSDDDLKSGLYRDTYFWQKTADAWEFWQASRAALVVELPVPTMSQYANRHSYNCAVEALGWAKDAIEAVGVEVKR
ncbi:MULTISPECIES: hypothetical protein [Pseudomonas]|uniref:Phage protein n=1 Tax=Pseudomonas luteola TaxID=47886 RepID=A0ABS0FPI5_PSELU|nr:MULTISPECIES: hypothetical protein [Pseudomonas]MBF8642286.1 hypothetical protein [Pseudomonas zeshuii]SHJ24018.1 hypothetical protein SAMN05216295_109207 [Pseudomonas zeshuii]